MDLHMFLDMLGSPIGTLLLCGRFCLSWRFPFVWTWKDMPRKAREQAMLSWATSRFLQLRKVYAAGCTSDRAHCSGAIAFLLFACIMQCVLLGRGSRH